VALNELAYSRTSDKLYLAALQKGLAVMDGAKDSITQIIGFPGWVERPCWCPDENKVYCSAAAGARRYIAVIDCNTDSVVRTIDVYDGVDGFDYLGEGRILCVRCYGLTLIDTHADSVLVDTAIVPSNYHSVARTDVGGKVYVARNGKLYVLSCSSLSLLATIDWPYGGPVGGGGSLLCTDTTRKLYWFSDWGDSTLAIDTQGDTVTARMPIGGWRSLSCFNHTGRYLFCFSRHMRVYDTQTDSLVAECPIPFEATSVTPNPEQGCIYIGCEDAILVYSDVPPGVEEAPNAEVRTANPMPTVVRGILFLSEAASPKPQAARLLDVSGRRVMNLRAGANYVRALAPGVYFVRTAQAQAQAQAVRKIVLTE
jgi:hypothetical protein